MPRCAAVGQTSPAPPLHHATSCHLALPSQACLLQQGGALFLSPTLQLRLPNTVDPPSHKLRAPPIRGCFSFCSSDLGDQTLKSPCHGHLPESQLTGSGLDHRGPAAPATSGTRTCQDHCSLQHICQNDCLQKTKKPQTQSLPESLHLPVRTKGGGAQWRAGAAAGSRLFHLLMGGLLPQLARRVTPCQNKFDQVSFWFF